MSALLGAVGFLTRFPTGTTESAWEAFRTTPAAIPAVGWLLGPVVAAPLLVPVAAPTAAALFLAWVYVCTGINHVDGVADIGDAMVVHGGPEDRRSVMTDTTLGVGGVLAVGIVLAGLALAALSLASIDRLPVVVAIVVGAEVGAKAGLAAVICLSTAAHEGLGSAFTSVTDRRSLLGVAVVTAPVVLLVSVTEAALIAALAGLLTALVIRLWARRRIGGVSGDVFGAITELSRVVALHAGVVAWTQL